MKISDIKDIKAIVWDLEQTLYPYDEAFQKESRKALARTILELGIEMTGQEAFDYAEAAYPMRTIKRLVNDFDVDFEEGFYTYYNNLDPLFLNPSQSFTQGLNNSKVAHGLLTNANRNWTDKALYALGLEAVFDVKNIVSIDDMNGASKSNDTAPYQMICTMLDIDTKNSVMVDDKTKNLYQAKKLGMMTVLITGGDKNPDTSHADFIFDTAEEFLHKFNQVRNMSVQAKPSYNKPKLK